MEIKFETEIWEKRTYFTNAAPTFAVIAHPFAQHLDDVAKDDVIVG